jgi:tRNA U34 5-methylaminomethyl-2-thiouridine-forming methyltransferase MnmC
MQRNLVLTKDGSHTIEVPGMNVTYHSIHGAIQESLHVFIEAGLRYYQNDHPIRIFEMGFGTGLNALLTLIESGAMRFPIHYTTIELYPLHADEVTTLNYCKLLQRNDLQPLFEKLHLSAWEKDIAISNHFTLFKSHKDLLDFSPSQNFTPYDIVFYDAFAPSAQPELWTTDIFEKLYSMLLPGGLLLTYCSKGIVRRSMQAAGFTVEKIPGPPGKREMVRARKNEK